MLVIDKKMNIQERSVVNMGSRRKFFKTAGGGFLGISLLSFSPFKLFSKKQNDVKIEVKAHPMAVKRTGRK